MDTPPGVAELRRRIDTLFGVAERPDTSPPDATSPVASADEVECFTIPLPDPRPEATNPVHAANKWLDTPNATFGGLCPRNFLDGSAEQRAFLTNILSSLEDG